MVTAQPMADRNHGATRSAGPPVAEMAGDRSARGALAEVKTLLEAYGDHPSISLALNRRMRYFTAPPEPGLIAYRIAGRYAFQVGGVVAPPSAARTVLKGYLEWTRTEGLEPCAVQVRDHDVDLYHRCGFRLNQMGLSYTLQLDRFDTRGTKFMRLRNKVRRARGEGIEVAEAGRDLPWSPALRAALDDITRSWLRGKGRWKKLLEFLVGEVDAIESQNGRCFVAVQRTNPIAFISYVPSYGRYPGLLHDLSRRRRESPPGVMELINLEAIRRFQSERVPFLNFGFTPFTGVRDQLGSHSRAVAAVVGLLARHGATLYPAATQAAYKLKWDPHIIEPEYFAFRGRFRAGCLWHLLRLTRSI